LSTLKHGIHWVRLLYTVLFLLGLQLPLAMVMATTTVLKEDRTMRLAR
jgi:hypothetical protein